MGVLETTYRRAIERPLRILAVFNEFYGEDKVDMQGYPSLSEVESALPDNASVSAVTFAKGSGRTELFQEIAL